MKLRYEIPKGKNKAPEGSITMGSLRSRFKTSKEYTVEYNVGNILVLKAFEGCSPEIIKITNGETIPGNAIIPSKEVQKLHRAFPSLGLYEL